MNYFRNHEAALEYIFAILLSGCLMAGAGFLCGMPGAIAAGAAAFSMIAFHFVSSHRRYRKIAELADDVGNFLHGFSEISFAAEKEGELAILKTEIGKMVQALRTQSELLQKDKQYLADSIADISHQIRTPLTSLNLQLAGLMAGSSGRKQGQAQPDILKEMAGLLRHTEWLVETLLKISKLDAGAISMPSSPVFAGELVRLAAEPLLIPIELKQQELICDIPGNVCLQVNLKWMAEAVGNIIKNCMEHTPEKGVIRISAEENSLYCAICIEDSGPGIHPDDLPHIFERFYKGRTPPDCSHPMGSAGIGLALARSIVSRQNGTLSAENKLSGAKFEIRFYKSAV